MGRSFGRGLMPALACALPAGVAAALVVMPGGAAHAQRPDRAPDFIYARTCGYCHGHNVGPIIRGRDLPPEAIRMFVRHGNGAMPAFKPTEITDSELDALARWISTTPVDPKEKGQ